MAKKTLDDPHNVFHYLLTTHAPLIQKSINSLRAKGHLPAGMEDWEFHEAGMRGLMEAVSKYDPKFGPFSAYANASIRGRIQSHADSQHEIPKHIRMQAKRFGQMQQSVPAAGSAAAPDKPSTTPAPNIDKPKI